MTAEQFKIDHLYRFDELTETLHALADEFPELVSISEIGRSHEDRAIWLATVTNTATGDAGAKPAVWVDANIHSVEITGSMAALHLLRTLVERRDEPEIAHVLATRTFYIVPRLNPDGAELALADNPTYLRSGVRPSRNVANDVGWVPGDVDGDGRVLDIRVVDPNGAWKVSDLDERIMVPRQPEDIGDGPWYRIIDEGSYSDVDDSRLELRKAVDPRNLDFNRHFPYGWHDESEQKGAGRAPGIEPEVRALMDAVLARPNICVYLAHHTFSAAILRPYDDKPDTAFPGDDLRRYKAITQKGTDLTGYRGVSVFHDFGYDTEKPISGAADCWAYDHLGIYGFTTEFWSPIAQAGITDYHLTGWMEDHPVADEVTLLKWNDSILDGKGFAPWTAFDHPQLGAVEIGGWDRFRCWENAPDHLLEAEVAPHTDWEIWLALTTPLLRIRDTVVESLGDGLVRVSCVVENAGYFPTSVTEQAVKRSLVDPVTVGLVTDDSFAIVSGLPVQELGQLDGTERARNPMSFAGRGHDYSTDRAVAHWVLRVEPGAEITITASHPRAGSVTTHVNDAGGGSRS